MRTRGGAGSVGALTLGAVLAGVALFADLLASDLPVAAIVDGKLRLLPCVSRPADLRDLDPDALAARAAWILPTPIGHGPDSSYAGPLLPPTRQHLLGTDGRGRDVAARLCHGTRTALLVGAGALALQLLLGVALGVACATGRLADLVLTRFAEVAAAVPTFFLLLALQALALGRGSSSLVEVAVAIALTRWPEILRVTRAEALRVVGSPHVEAARAIGLAPLQIAVRHVLPHAVAPALATASMGIAQAVLAEAGLSFLGFGVPPPTASWGQLLAEAHAAGLPLHLLLPPSLAIALVVVTGGLLADALAERLQLDARA